jgi:predicted DNA-binding ribbon-helix-helix protein
MKNRQTVAHTPDYRQGSTPRPNPASTGRRMKRNVRVGDRRTTIVLEAYVWDCIDSMLQRENVTLDAFCNMIEGVRRSSSMASSARLIVLAYFRLLQQINTPPFVDPDIVNKQQSGTLESLPPPTGPLPVLQLAIRRFAQDEAHGR